MRYLSDIIAIQCPANKCVCIKMQIAETKHTTLAYEVVFYDNNVDDGDDVCVTSTLILPLMLHVLLVQCMYTTITMFTTSTTTSCTSSTMSTTSTTTSCTSSTMFTTSTTTSCTSSTMFTTSITNLPERLEKRLDLNCFYH